MSALMHVPLSCIHVVHACDWDSISTCIALIAIVFPWEDQTCIGGLFIIAGKAVSCFGACCLSLCNLPAVVLCLSGISFKCTQ